ncbi:MAG: recombination protein RecR [Paludibacteraceae bacterium]|nr:recombination protein RecR [Paludibacteraceae bacterium]
MLQSYPSYLLENAVNQLAKLPGVGRKSALRLALYLLRQDEQSVQDFAGSVLMLRQQVNYCKHCRNISDTDECAICQDRTRDRSIVCVVETVKEVMLVENTGRYRGLYHVLGGVISPMDGIKPSDLEIDSLAARVAAGGIDEVVLALSTTMEGDTTAYYIAKKLSGLPVRLTTIARGVAQGDELQYADELTLGNSIVNRVPYAK